MLKLRVIGAWLCAAAAVTLLTVGATSTDAASLNQADNGFGWTVKHETGTVE